jgi:hypothetical protein
MQDKFSFYLDDNNVAKQTDLEILGLSKNYFDTNDFNAFKKHVIKIVMDIHPDKNKDSLRSTEAFKVVHAAIERIKENIAHNGTYVKPVNPDNASIPTQNASFNFNFGFAQSDFSWWNDFNQKARDDKAKWNLWEEEVVQEAAREEDKESLVKDFNQMTPLEKLQIQVQQFHQKHQKLFNAVIDEYLSVAEQWTANGFISKPNLYDIRDYREDYFDLMTNFYGGYAKLLEQVGSTTKPTTAFKIMVSSFDCYGSRIPVYIRPNNIPFDLPQFIEHLNADLNYNLRRLNTDQELRAEKLPIIQFSYTGKNPRVSSLYEKKPRNYHQLTVNALVEAHTLLQDWYISTKKLRDWALVTKGEQDLVFKQSDFCKLLEAHPTLSGFYPKVFYELYFSAFKDAEEGCTDVQSLVNAIKERLKQATLNYSDFDDFSAYTGTNEKVLQFIKEKAEAEQAKIQNPYNKHIEDVYNATKKLIKPDEIATVFKYIGTYSFTSISYGELRNEEAAVATAYDEAFNPDGSFNLKAYQQSINFILKNKLNQDLVYTGKNESVQNYFHPKHPADFHQLTFNRLLEAHVKVKPWWDEYGPGSLGDEELIKQFYQSEFCKIIEEHPILKELLPHERKYLYLSIFKDSKGRYDIPAFIQKFKKALQQESPYFYQSYAEVSEYTGASDAVKKAVQSAEVTAQAAELAAVQKRYNEFLEKTYEEATVSYYDREKKIDWFKKFNHRIFLSIEPDKLNQLSMLDSFIASLDEKNIFDLLAFQTALNAVLETNLNLKMQYTGTDEKVLEALQISVARNAVESKPPEIPAVLDKPKENTRERQPVPDDVPVPRAEAEPDPHSKISQKVAPDATQPESVSEADKSTTKQNPNQFFSASSSTKKEENASKLHESLQAYINERKKEWSFHYNFLGLVALVYFLHDRLWGTHYSEHKSRETKIKAAENIMNGNFPLNDPEKAAASEGRLGNLLNEFGGLEEILKNASEPTKDDQNLQF